MDKPLLTREQIETAAIRIGAPKASIFKWRKRGIPPAWQMRIVINSSGSISPEDMIAFVAKAQFQAAA